MSLAHTMSTASWQSDTCTAPIVSRVAAEFREMPGMRLTEVQVKRLFNLTPEDCKAVLEQLVECRLLSCDHAGRYGLWVA
jgi:hypothetical protein